MIAAVKFRMLCIIRKIFRVLYRVFAFGLDSDMFRKSEPLDMQNVSRCMNIHKGFFI